MGWGASRKRVEQAGGAFGRKPFSEAGAPRVREGASNRRLSCSTTILTVTKSRPVFVASGAGAGARLLNRRDQIVKWLCASGNDQAS
jgi:hypothetical protein